MDTQLPGQPEVIEFRKCDITWIRSLVYGITGFKRLYTLSGFLNPVLPQPYMEAVTDFIGVHLYHKDWYAAAIPST